MIYRVHESISDIDWKIEVKAWDSNPFSYRLTFRHNGKLISIDSRLSGKKYILVLFVDGVWKGIYSSAGHENYVYHKLNEVYISKPKARKGFLEMAKRRGQSKEVKDYFFGLATKKITIAYPWFSSMAQVKKMALALK